MKVAVLARQQDPFSLRNCRENMVQELTALGVEVVPFAKAGPIPAECDLVWEPGLGMRGIPRILKSGKAPIIATMHGLRAFSLPSSELARNWKTQCREQITKLRVTYGWHWFRKRVSAIITVSEFGAEELACTFGLLRGMVYPIYHGVAHGIFRLDGQKQITERPYLFHVSSDSPRKNLDRVFSAYTQLPEHNRPDLVVILPSSRCGKRKSDTEGVKLIRQGISHTELAKWYRGALGFVFPSLYENFGLPILEAMACGCPVITSNVTACPEVAGDAALLVDPRSIDEIANAMWLMVEDESLCQSLRHKGLARAQQFTWRKSAEEHLDVFEKVLAEKT